MTYLLYPVLPPLRWAILLEMLPFLLPVLNVQMIFQKLVLLLRFSLSWRVLSINLLVGQLTEFNIFAMLVILRLNLVNRSMFLFCLLDIFLVPWVIAAPRFLHLLPGGLLAIKLHECGLSILPQTVQVILLGPRTSLEMRICFENILGYLPSLVPPRPFASLRIPTALSSMLALSVSLGNAQCRSIGG